MKKGENMNREIKFRIIHNGKTYYWGYCEGGFAGIPTSNNGLTLGKAKDLSCQFTGLKDKNGKEIYEGDICEGPSGPTKKVKAKIVYDGFGVPGLMALDCCQFMDLAQVGAEVGFKNIEIIGNLYENPELLEPKP